jgi:diguanylate cyclase (GGDEF)-like protein/PAS domain S-box-containing protein
MPLLSCPRRAAALLLVGAALAPLPAAADLAEPVAVSPWGLAIALLGAALALTLMYLGRLSTQLRRSEASLARAEAEWVEALDFAEEAMYLADLDDRVMRANKAFLRYIDLPAEAVIGQRIARLIHGEREHEPCPVCAARRACRDAVFVKEADDPVNRLGRPIEIVVKVIRDRHGEPTGILQVTRDLSRQRAAEHAIRESEQRYRNLSQAAFDGIAIVEDGVVVEHNPALAAMLGREPGALVGQRLLDLVAAPSRAAMAAWLECASNERLEVEMQRPDGVRLTAEARARDFPHEGRTRRVIALRDMRELRRAQQALHAETERLRVTLRSIGEAVVVTDTGGRVQYLNPVAEALLGVGEAVAAGVMLADLCRIVDEVQGREPLDLVRACLERGAIVRSRNNCLLRRGDGREFAVEHSTGPIRGRDGHVIGVVLALRDVSEMRHLARQLSFQASHDSLTGLINRGEFERRLEYALQSAKDGDRQHALCYLDLDQFKVVNDTCGHVAGDEMLKQIATLIASRIRDSDTVARLGGDEFGVLLEGCPLPKAIDIAETLRELLADFRFGWRDRSFDVGVSIGIATLSAASGSVTEAMSAADAACYVAKDLGRNRIHVHQPDDAALRRHHGEMEWAQRLSGALKDGRLCLYSQPIAALAGDDGHAWHEILVRMLDERGQPVLPMAFIPAAERYNLMPAVDRWVVATTLAWLRADAPANGRQAPLACTINLSGRSLGDERFLEFVLAEIAAAGVDPARVTFEITETAAVANFADAQKLIAALKRLGCRFALDDFGSGLSSFAYLKHLPVDYLKIDGNFVRDMAHDPIDRAMVEAINHLGHVMGLRTVAECVESAAVLERLRDLGVDYAQGHAVSPPAPIALAVAPLDMLLAVAAPRR